MCYSPSPVRDGMSSPTQLTVILATRNAGKLRELAPLFAGVQVNVRTLADVAVPETAHEDDLESLDTFEGNAFAKARWFFSQLADRPDFAVPTSTDASPTFLVIADDSGLEVDALRGAPGVHSKRWSGRTDLHGPALDLANNAYLLDQLAAAQAAGAPSRGARYICAAAAVWGGGELVVRGSTEGTLLSVPHGENGFGYDPYFWSTDLGMSFGEASRDAKAAVSHRGRAIAVMVEHLLLRDVLRMR